MTGPRGLTIGFWGLGHMGLPMARRLLDAGAVVVGFDPEPGALQVFERAGGRVEAFADVAARLDVALLMVPGSDAVESILSDSALGALRPGVLVVDASSSDPLRTRRLAARLQAKSLRLVDAPVSGGTAGAAAGTLAVMVGGADEDVAAAEPVLSAFGTPSHVGPVGAGHALKALNNLMSAVHLWATSEAMIAAARFGLDPAEVVRIVDRSSGRSGSTANKWPNFVLTGSFDSGFGLALMLKDMGIALDLAHELGLSTPVGDAARAAWSDAAGHLPTTADHTEIVRVIADTTPGPWSRTSEPSKGEQ